MQKIYQLEGISIIICCYNSEKLLPETLRHISMQKVNETLNWEVIVVNNNSLDKTKEVANKEWNKYFHNRNCSFKIVDEPNPGLSNAKKKGFETAVYDILIYCDDDNWLCENYVQIAYDSMRDNKIAVVGGCGEPIFENNCEPEWFHYFTSAYAVGYQIPNINKCVYGAGMVITKKSLQKLYSKGFKSLLTGRKGTVLSAGEDSEICFALVLLGYSIEYNPQLKFKHFLIEKRLNQEYLKNMYIGFAKANIILKIYKHHILKNKRTSTIYIAILYFFRSLIAFLYHQFNHKYKRKIMKIYDATLIKEWIKNITSIESLHRKNEIIIKFKNNY
jgi:glycosyltransferase involved in cell wall biosynthesis